MTRILIIIILVLILFIIIGNKSEHLDSSSLSEEAIQNIASIYASTKGEAVFNNLKVTGSSNLVPRGTIVSYYPTDGKLDKAPDTWALCDGTNGTPDLRGRFILGSGKGSDLSERKLNDKGGAETHTLTIEEMPSHNHELNGPWRDWRDIKGDSIRAGTITSQYDTWTTSSTGGSKPHNNMPPFYVLAYIMKL